MYVCMYRCMHVCMCVEMEMCMHTSTHRTEELLAFTYPEALGVGYFFTMLCERGSSHDLHVLMNCRYLPIPQPSMLRLQLACGVMHENTCTHVYGMHKMRREQASEHKRMMSMR